MTKEVSSDPSVRILKSGTCPTVSGKSKLTYQFGCDAAGNVAMRIATNSGGGFFSDEWLPLAAIEKALSGAKDGLSSGALRSIFKGKSVNTAGFLLAVLKAEGAVQLQEGKTRLYEVAEFDGFLAKVRELMRPASEKAPAARGRAPKAPATAGKAIQRPAAKRG